MCSPVSTMNRTVRRRSVAVPWSLFPKELSVGQVLSLSLLWRGHDCRTWTVVCASSPQGQRTEFSIPIFSCGYAVCSGLLLAGISRSVLSAISEGCLVGEYSLHFCALGQLASCFWWAFLLLFWNQIQVHKFPFFYNCLFTFVCYTTYY